MIKYSFITVLLFILTACISTNVRDFTDPDYQAFTAKKLLVITPSQEFDDVFLKTIKYKNVNVATAKFSDLFLPTRKYSTEEMISTIKRKGFDSAIYITIAGDESNSQVISYMTNSSAQAYSSGYGNAYATGSSTTIPIASHKRNTTSKAKLLDPVTQRKIWVADLNTKASDSLYVQNDDTMESISEEVINALLKRRHLVVNGTKK